MASDLPSEKVSSFLLVSFGRTNIGAVNLSFYSRGTGVSYEEIPAHEIVTSEEEACYEIQSLMGRSFNDIVSQKYRETYQSISMMPSESISINPLAAAKYGQQGCAIKVKQDQRH